MSALSIVMKSCHTNIDNADNDVTDISNLCTAMNGTIDNVDVNIIDVIYISMSRITNVIDTSMLPMFL